ncbi:hypothetical protein SOVF_150300, partial [Spinacia oleracea]
RRRSQRCLNFIVFARLRNWNFIATGTPLLKIWNFIILAVVRAHRYANFSKIES